MFSRLRMAHLHRAHTMSAACRTALGESVDARPGTSLCAPEVYKHCTLRLN